MTERDRMADSLAELKQLGAALFEHLPVADLLTMLFPPALAYDLAGPVISQQPVEGGEFDPEMPDRELLEAALALAGWFAEHYFRAEINDVAQVPASGPVLLVGNHSAGLMPLDALFAYREIRRLQGDDRFVHPLVHDFAYAAPRVARNAYRMGILRAKREYARDALDAGRIVLVYPGGDQEAFRPFKERYKIVLAGRKGFIRLALAAGAPIVPLVSVGLHESFMILTRGETLAKRLGLKQLLRTDVLPVGLSFPWGLAPAFFPFMPLPSKVEMRFGAPLTFDAAPDDEDAVQAAYDEIESTMQSMMDELSAGRITLLGR